MEKIKDTLLILQNALKSLEKSIELFYEYQHIFIHDSSQKNKDLLLSMRDSMIQRFEYCTDLFWKIIKIYLQSQGVSIAAPSPRGILREAVKARLLSESEGNECMEMIESRNKTSHIYHEIMGEEIAQQIPIDYELLKSITDRIQNK